MTKFLEGKRKFLIALLALVMSFALALLDKVDGGNWVMVTTAIVGLYGGAEALEGRGHAKYGTADRHG